MTKPLITKRLLLLLLLAGCAQAEIVDRIVATVGRKVITASTVRQQLRIAALLEGTPKDESPAALEAMRNRLIDRLLILEEMRVSRYPIPEAAEVKAALDAEIAQAGGPAAFDALLTRHQLTPAQINLSLRHQAAIFRFTVYRFRPAVQISAAQVQAYYDQRLPAAAPKPPLEEVRDQIEQVLRLEQINTLLNRWLSEIRQQTHIETYEGPTP